MTDFAITPLKTARARRGWSQAKVCVEYNARFPDASPLVRATLARYENGDINPSLPVAQRLGILLGGSVNVLFPPQDVGRVSEGKQAPASLQPMGDDAA